MGVSSSREVFCCGGFVTKNRFCTGMMPMRSISGASRRSKCKSKRMARCCKMLQDMLSFMVTEASACESFSQE